LRKEFIIDEYQVVESRSLGADVILLIAACLSSKTVRHLAAAAKRVGLEVLLEIHDETELDHICPDVDIVGVNNRDLRTFVVDISRSIQLSRSIPAEKLRISESGLNTASDIFQLREAGYSGFLIGEKFMREADPEQAFLAFMNTLTAESVTPAKGGKSV
jgi:indole-3-glycerol phosphate synthase